MTRKSMAVLAVFVTLVATHAFAGPQAPAPRQAASSPSLVNLNTATVAQLDALPGVGVKLAERIIAYRQKNGGFKKVEDLMNVSGIGEKNFLKLKPLVTVTPVQSNPSQQ